MTTEDYCSYEVAKLLKEKGFRAKCNRYYNAQYDETRTVSDTFIMDFNDEDLMKVLSMEGAFNIPTHQMAMKWLRDIYSISIEPYCYEYGWYCGFSQLPKGITIYTSQESKEYGTYEEVVEAALKYSLKNLI